MKKLFISIFDYISEQQKIILYLSIILCALIILVSVYVNYNNGTFHYENDVYIPHFLSDKPLLMKIFNPITELANGKNFFRAREVGTFFNYVDTSFIFYCFRLGIPHFLSMVHYLSLIIISLMTIFFAKKYLTKKMFVITILLLILFLTSPAPFLTGLYYRTSKILTSLGIFFMFWLITIKKNSFGKNESRYSHLTSFLLTFFIVTFTCLADEQGLAYMILAFIIPLVYFKFYERKNFLPLVWGFLFSFIFVYLYRKILDPFLYLIGSGTNHAQIQYAGTLSFQNFKQGFFLLSEYVQQFFGNIGMIGAFILIGFSIFIMFHYISKKNINQKYKLIPVSVLIIGIVYIVFLLNLMTIAHPPLLWADVKIVYYTLPPLMVIFCTSIYLIQKLIEQNPGLGSLTAFFLLLMIVSNSVLLNNNNRIFYSGHLHNKGFKIAPLIIFAVYHPDIPLAQALKSSPASPLPQELLSPVGQKIGGPTTLILRQRIGKNDNKNY